MSYEKQTWQTGDTVTSAKLNHMEDGIASAGGGGVLVATDTDGALNKTWQEMYDSAVPIFVLKAIEANNVRWWFPVVQAAYDPEGGYWVGVLDDTSTVNYYVCQAATDYPVLEIIP